MNNFFYVLIYLLAIFGSPVPILTIIIAKIYLGKKFSNKAFYINLIFFFILSFLITYTYLKIFFKIPIPKYFFETKSYIEILNSLLSKISLPYCYIFLECFIYLFSILLICTLIYFYKTKNKDIFKKFFISILILAPFMHDSYAISGITIKNFLSTQKESEFFIDKVKIAETKVIFPPLKASLAEIIAGSIKSNYSLIEIYHLDKNPENIQKMVDEYIKYNTISSDIVGYDFNSVKFLNEVQRYDEALRIIDKIESRYGKPLSERVKILLNKKDYQKALEIIEQADYRGNSEQKLLDYISIYAGLNDFDKAYQYLNEYKKIWERKNHLYPYKRIKIYLDYKSGMTELAEKSFEELKNETTAIKNSDFNTFIEQINKSDIHNAFRV